jgi:PTH1 family peptidyl-tRNA hydrolase
MAHAIELIVGLGNPDPAHLPTRHNAGFWLVDLIARECGAVFKPNRRLAGALAEVEIQGQRVRLLKPQTYMNDSGRSVAAAMSYFKIPPERMLVAYDELDLDPGRAQLKFDGGHGGHNGLRDVVECVGSEFWRLRLGIGHPEPGRREAVVGYVLRRPTPEELEKILESVAAAAKAIPVLLEQGPERAMTQLHSRGRQSKPHRKAQNDAVADD